jgi:hypothetical protein
MEKELGMKLFLFAIENGRLFKFKLAKKIIKMEEYCDKKK